MKRKWSRVYRDTIGGAGQREAVEPLESRVVLAGVGAAIAPAAVAEDAFGAVSVGANVNVSRSTGHEVGGTIAIDPTNPARLFAATETEGGSGSRALLGAYSIDGGATWTTRPLASGIDDLPRGEHNPQAAFDPFGNLYVTYLETVAQRAVHVAVSTDGGQTFAALHSVVGPALDQPSIAVGGDSTAGASSVWVSYRNSSGSISATGARATGIGAIGTFGAPQSVSAGVGNFGDVAVGPQGQLIVTWQTNTAGEGAAAVRVSTDVDGLGSGKFSAPRTVAATNVGGFDFLPAQPNRAIAAQAGLAYDLSPGRRRGWLYLIYTDESPDESNDFDVYVRSSIDHGHTWSAPVRVNDDGTGRSQFLPEIAVDQATGRLAVGWYDAREDAGVIGAGSQDGVANNEVALWGAVSTDGAATFQNFRVAAGASNAAAASQPNDLGDNIGLAFHNGIVRPVWADNGPALPNNGGRPKSDLATAAVVVGPQAGPRVVLSDPGGLQFAPTDHVDFQFDRRMDPASFTLAGDVRAFTGPSGSLLSRLTGFQWLNDNRTLRVSFQPLTAAGQYSTTLGPDILSAGATAMDQDADGIPAESTADRYTQTFTLAPPRVVSHGPASPQVGTLGNFEFEFNQPMDPASFTVVDDVITFTSPVGEDLRASVTGFVWLNDNRRLRVEFDNRGAEGPYTMVIGPGIASAGGGWAMDQDGDLIPGEAATDRYTGTVTVDRSIGPDGFGYQAITHALQSIDLVPGASGVSTAVDDADDATASIPLGSNRFNFYGRTYTGSNALYVSSNGLITFGGAHGDFRNGDLTSAPSRPTIAPLWDDWRTDVGTDSRVLYRFDNLSGDSAPERLVIEWNAVPNASGALLDPATFQAILQLNTSAIQGEITLNYPDLGVTAATANDGASATVGIKGDGTQGSHRLLVSLNSATSPYVATGKAIRFATTTQPSQPPTVSTLTAAPLSVQTGAPLTLTAESVVDVDGGITAVNFYRESNGRSGLQTGSGGDALVGTDTSSAGGYAVTFLATGLDDDTYTYYAQAVDNRALMSFPAVTTHVVDNGAPTVDIVSVSPDPRSETVRSITIRFSEPVTGFDIADLTLKRNNGPNLLTNQSLLSLDGVTWTLGSGTTLAPVAGNYVLALTASGSGVADLAGNPLAGGDSDSWRQNAQIVSRLTFYNQSNFDGYTPDATANDDIAVAADKTALLPGNRATFANITSYDKGINGVIIDMWGLVQTPTAADFQFRVGKTGDPSRWALAPAPTSILRRPGRGEDDSDRITITWAKGAIRNQWLRVTVLANANTGLVSSDVFYFGNLVGEAGNLSPTSTEARVTAFDVADVRRNYSPINVLVTNRWDFNRDGKVNALDVVIARANYQRDALNLLQAP